MEYDNNSNIDDHRVVPLRLMGITYNPVHNGVYAMLLTEVNGDRRIPVVVGTAEARSIAMAVEHIVPQRPNTHDLMLNMMREFDIKLSDVVIYEFAQGTFKSQLHFMGSDGRRGVESRTSDAIALALRAGAPIFATGQVLRTAGITLDTDAIIEGTRHKLHKVDTPSISDLQQQLDELVEREEYEQAAEVQKMIRERLHDTGGAQ